MGRTKEMKIDGRVRKGERTREKIISAVFKVIGQRGIEGFKTSQIASEAKVKKGVIFHHFSSTEDILIAAFNKLVFRNEFRVVGISCVSDYLNELGKNLATQCKTHPQFVRSLFSLYERAIHSPVHKKIFLRIVDSFERKVRTDLLETRQITVDSYSNELRDLITGTIDGLVYHLLIHKDEDRFLKSWMMFSAAIEGYLLKGSRK